MPGYLTDKQPAKKIQWNRIGHIARISLALVWILFSLVTNLDDAFWAFVTALVAIWIARNLVVTIAMPPEAWQGEELSQTEFLKLCQAKSRIKVEQDGLACEVPDESIRLDMPWETVLDYYLMYKRIGTFNLYFAGERDDGTLLIPIQVTPAWFAVEGPQPKVREAHHKVEVFDTEFNDWVEKGMEDGPLFAAIEQGLQPWLEETAEQDLGDSEEWQGKRASEILVNQLVVKGMGKSINWLVLAASVITTLAALWFWFDAWRSLNTGDGSGSTLDLLMQKVWWTPALLLPWIWIKGRTRLSHEEIELLVSLPSFLSLDSHGISFILSKAGSDDKTVLLRWKDIKQPVTRLGAYLMLNLKKSSLFYQTVGIDRLRIYPTYHYPDEEHPPKYRMKLKDRLVEVHDKDAGQWRPVKPDDSPIIKRILWHLDAE